MSPATQAVVKVHGSPRVTFGSNAHIRFLVQVRATQAKIKHTLTERWYAWEDAWKVAEKDPEVDLKGDLDAPAYQPRALEVRN